MARRSFDGGIIFRKHNKSQRKNESVIYALSDFYNLFKFFERSKYKKSMSYEAGKAYRSIKDIGENLEYKKETYQYLKWYLLNIAPLNKNQKNILFYIPLKQVPIYINDEDYVVSLISTWRLKIGK
jgi:hypothetical protein